MQSIHTVDVRRALNNYLTNPITANRLHPIDGSEQKLPRRTKATLAQLKSVWCHITNHYMSIINPEIQDICPIAVYPVMMYIICSTTPGIQQHWKSDHYGPTPIP